MLKLFGLSLLLVCSSSLAFAGISVAPEIDSGSAASAIVLLSGGLLVLRARRKR